MKFTKYISTALFAIAVVLTVLFVINIDRFALENIATATATRGLLDYFLIFAYVLLGVGALCAVLMPVPSVIGNPKALKGILVLLVIAVVFVGISYLLATDIVPANVALPESEFPSPGMVKTVEAGIILAYFLFATALVSIIGSGIYNSIRNR